MSHPPRIGATSEQLASAIYNIAHRDEWTPTLTFATPGDLTVAYTTRVGWWSKIGRQFTATFEIVTSTFTHTTAAGNCQITGLPFTVTPATGIAFYGSLRFQGITKANYTQIVPRLSSNSAIIDFPASGSAQAASTVAVADMPTAGTVIFGGEITGWID